MKWTQVPLGPLQTNAYVIWNDELDAIIIDPGGDGETFVQWLKKEGLNPLAIILTHAHFDHIGGVDYVRHAYDCPVYIHQAEQDWLLDPALNRSSHYPGNLEIITKPAEHIIREEGKLAIGPFTFSVFETPGHSPGSVSYYIEKEAIIFSGDVLFAQGIGRTDLPEGSEQQLFASIKEKLLVLPEETVVACGHGQTTTIGRAMDENPYISGF